MFNPDILHRREFHDSVIEDTEWNPSTQCLSMYGEFPESEQTDVRGCRMTILILTNGTVK